MSESIIAALISAASSIMVAMIGARTAKGQKRGAAPRPLPGAQLPPLTWGVTLALLAVWLLVSPGAIHHDFSGSNFFVIPLVLSILAVVRPIRPLTAAWVSLAVSSANFILGPLGNRLAGSGYDTQFVLEREKYPLLLLLVFSSAALVAGICALRLRFFHRSASAVLASNGKRDSASSRNDDHALAASLEKLAALHSAGKLSDAEFSAAKQRLLKGDERR